MSGARAWFVVVAGPSAAGSRFMVDRSAVLGRRRDNEIYLPDNSSAGRHARVERGRAGWHLHDLGSTNGTFLNGVRIQRSAVLHNDDLVYVGHWALRFFTQEPARLLEVRRVGDWLLCNPFSRGESLALSTRGVFATALSAPAGAEVLASPVAMAGVPLLLDRVGDTCVVEDIAGVSLAMLRATTGPSARIEPQIVVEAALRELELVSMTAMGTEGRLSFRGQLVQLGVRGRPRHVRERTGEVLLTLARDLGMTLLVSDEGFAATMSAAMSRCPELGPLGPLVRSALEAAWDQLPLQGRMLALQEAVGGPPAADLIRGLGAALFPAVLADDAALREEVGVLGVEGLEELAAAHNATRHDRSKAP